MKPSKWFTLGNTIHLLRISLALIWMAHGSIRLYAGTVADFGGFLDSKGFPAGVALAWGLTVFELAGGLLLLANRFTQWIALGFFMEALMGIILVHAANGWFVVGYQSGGMEYNYLLMVCLLLIAAAAKKT